jgi:acetyl-CoA carboxylase biotin carboxyl carrier protein
MARKDVVAEVTGTVWKIEAAIGTEVDADTPVVVVESMKMEIPVLAPDAGRVVAITVSEGDVIEEGQVVAVIEF